MRVVVDTNLWVSYLLQPNSPVAEQLTHIIRTQTLLYSHATLGELVDVLSREKFAGYYNKEDFREFIAQFLGKGERVQIDEPIVLCRDPRDDKFLELAVSGQADCILTGDEDLLTLNPFRGVAIWKLKDFPW